VDYDGEMTVVLIHQSRLGIWGTVDAQGAERMEDACFYDRESLDKDECERAAHA